MVKSNWLCDIFRLWEDTTYATIWMPSDGSLWTILVLKVKYSSCDCSAHYCPVWMIVGLIHFDMCISIHRVWWWVAKVNPAFSLLETDWTYSGHWQPCCEFKHVHQLDYMFQTQGPGVKSRLAPHFMFAKNIIYLSYKWGLDCPSGGTGVFLMALPSTWPPKTQTPPATTDQWHWLHMSCSHWRG